MLRNRKFYFFVLPAVLVIAVLIGFPVVKLFWLSGMRYDLMKGVIEPIGWANFQRILGDTEFLHAILRTLLYVVVVVTANFVLGLTMAVVADRPFKGNRLFQLILMFPMLLIPTAAGVLWRFMYNPTIGPLNSLLKALSLPQVAWLSSSSLAVWSIMLVDIWAWTPYMFLVLYAGLKALPQEPLEAARIDGAGSFKVLRYVTLPMLRPVVFVAVSLKFIDTFRVFAYPWVLTEGGPGGSSHVMSTYIYLNAFRNLKYGLSSAMAVVAMLISLTFSSIFLYFAFTRGRGETA